MLENNMALEGLIEEITGWFEAEIFITANLVSLAALLITGAAVFILRKRLRRWGEMLLQALPFKTPGGWFSFWSRVHFQLSWAALLWGYNFTSAALGYPTPLTLIAGYLIGAWLLIQIVRKLLPDSVLVRFISLVIWVVAVLNIVGVYGPVVGFLEQVRFNLGDFQVSVMLILRGAVFFVILFWAASSLEVYLRRYLQKSGNLTPSVSILLQKLLRITLYTAVFLILLSSIGIDISAFAVIGGAVGVGLGFGLQKIVSNFISGIIIILDRSIKPGDIVEIDDVFGKVRALNTRFVSVVTLAGKEYLIPNESFITNQVINWSYSDNLVRIDAVVGVGYDSDLKLVRELMIKAMEEQSRILKDPPPTCLLKEFGDNTVDFELRFWIKDADMGVGNIKSDVLLEIWGLLKEHGVNIAFPQRDLHVKTVSSQAARKLKDILSRGNESG